MLRAPQYAVHQCPRCDVCLSNVQGIAVCFECDWIHADHQRR